MQNKEKTLLVIYPGTDVMQDCTFHLLVAETGEPLAGHYCSHSFYAYGDLYESREERIKEWTDRFGEFEVKYINQSDITESELLKRNREWGVQHASGIEGGAKQAE